MSVPRGCKCLKCGQRCRNKHSAVTALWPQRLQNSFFAMTGGTAQLPSVLIWGILIVADNILTPWVRFKLVYPRSNVVYPDINMQYARACYGERVMIRQHVYLNIPTPCILPSTRSSFSTGMGRSWKLLCQ